MKPAWSIAIIAAVFIWTHAADAAPPSSCPPDAVPVGTGCMDKYEASVWRIPEPTGANKGLVRKVREGTATFAELTAASPPATQIGTVSDNYAPCTDTGQNCVNDIYAVSLPGVMPTAYTTWFQAVEACTNSAKRLPSNAEWQAAANGSPDPGPDNGTTDCNTASANNPVATGSRANCVSARGAFDMVGNLFEWVGEWVAPATACPPWLQGSDDHVCFAGAQEGYGPAAIIRGGYVGSGTGAGPLMVNAASPPDGGDNDNGFRCVR